MSCLHYRITNFNSIQDGYYKWTGCTGSVSITKIVPLFSENICAESITVEPYGAPLDIVDIGLCPSSTPTPSITPTVTPTVSLTSTPTTQTPTPTNTTTPSTTPSPYYVQNLRTGGYYQDVCQSINQFGGFPANVTVYSAKPFRQLTVGDHVYGNREFSIPPVGANFTISDGVKIIQIGGTLIINAGVC
jgi:hypothetical protein